MNRHLESDMTEEPIKVFFSYSREDEKFKNELVKHLSLLQREKVISGWHDRMIAPALLNLSMNFGFALTLTLPKEREQEISSPSPQGEGLGMRDNHTCIQQRQVN